MNARVDLFGESILPGPVDARETYRILHARDTVSPGCCDCTHCDWSRDRCRLAGRPVDVDFGTCQAFERRPA